MPRLISLIILYPRLRKPCGRSHIDLYDIDHLLLQSIVTIALSSNGFYAAMFPRLLVLCSLVAVQGALTDDCALARQRFNSTFEELMRVAPELRKTVSRIQPFDKLFPHCADPPSCTDLWASVRGGVPATCDATCWDDVERTFLRKHGECTGVLDESCTSRQC